MILTLSHGDGVSGMTILEDGTLALWTEGKGSHVDVIQENEIACVPASSDAPIIGELDRALQHHEARQMTTVEERICDTLRGLSWSVQRAISAAASS